MRCTIACHNVQFIFSRLLLLHDQEVAWRVWDFCPWRRSSVFLSQHSPPSLLTGSMRQVRFSRTHTQEISGGFFWPIDAAREFRGDVCFMSLPCSIVVHLFFFPLSSLSPGTSMLGVSFTRRPGLNYRVRFGVLDRVFTTHQLWLHLN